MRYYLVQKHEHNNKSSSIFETKPKPTFVDYRPFTVVSNTRPSRHIEIYVTFKTRNPTKLVWTSQNETLNIGTSFDLLLVLLVISYV